MYVYHCIYGPKSCFMVSLCVTIEQIFDSISVDIRPVIMIAYIDSEVSLKGPVLISTNEHTELLHVHAFAFFAILYNVCYSSILILRATLLVRLAPVLCSLSSYHTMFYNLHKYFLV